MGVTVVTLWLIYVLVILVITIILTLPDLRSRYQNIIAVFFATIIAAVVVTFVPVDLLTPVELSMYNFLLAIAYILPIILIIVIAASGIHHHFSRKYEAPNKAIEAEVVCDQDEMGNPENCRVENLKMRKSSSRNRNIQFR